MQDIQFEYQFQSVKFVQKFGEFPSVHLRRDYSKIDVGVRLRDPLDRPEYQHLPDT